MFTWRKLQEFFNPKAALVDQPHPSELTPLDLPAQTYANIQHTDEEKSEALKKFLSLATQHCIDGIANMPKGSFPPALKELIDLSYEFDNTEQGEDRPNWAYFIGRAIRYHDAELVRMIGKEMHKPFTEIYNPVMRKKLDGIANNTEKPALGIVR